ATGALRWAFALPPRDDRKPNQVQDFIYAGGRIYVSTSLGTFALGQDPEESTAPEGFVLEWKEPAATGTPSATGQGPNVPPAPPTGPRSAASLAEAWTRDAMQ